MPPKNITSVARKIHMPSSAAPRCCSASSNWWATAAAWSAMDRLAARVGVGLGGDHRGPLEVVARRRRRRLPLEAGRAPRVVARGLAVAQRPEEVDHRQQVADTQDGRAGRRHHVQHLELLGIGVVAPRHAERSEEHTSELQSPCNLVCRLLLEKKKKSTIREQGSQYLQHSTTPTAYQRHHNSHS